MGRPKDRNEYRLQLAESFAHVLEEKGLEWKQEWEGVSPRNGITEVNYRGCNAFNLSLVSMMKGYDDPRWVTMVQIMDKDGKYHPGEKWHLKKGSKATYVEYWFPYDIKNKVSITWDKYKDEIDKGRSENEFRVNARYTGVFNACEIEGMPEISAYANTDISADELISKLSAEMGVPILNDGGDRAFYSPLDDKIHLPAMEVFHSEYAYNATTLHELSHSTGHERRLNRPLINSFGTDGYAYEELVAEMSSCFMGINLKTEMTSEHMENHKAYVKSWIAAIKNKPDILIKVIKDAQDVANYMDFKAGLISEKEYSKLVDSTKVITKVKELDRER